MYHLLLMTFLALVSQPNSTADISKYSTLQECQKQGQLLIDAKNHDFVKEASANKTPANTAIYTCILIK